MRLMLVVLRSNAPSVVAMPVTFGKEPNKMLGGYQPCPERSSEAALRTRQHVEVAGEKLKHHQRM